MLRTQTITLNLGPQHPSTHGVLRIVLTMDGETIVDLRPIFGYLHRGIEKLAETRTYLQNIPLTDRMDYICSMSNNLAYVIAAEKLAGIEVPERAEYIRVIMAELTRVMNHLVAMGALLNDLGAFFTPMLYCLRERERILDLFDMTCGSRMTCNYMRFGGVAADVSEEFITQARKVVAALPYWVDDLDQLLTTNEVLLARLQGVGVLPREMAVNCSVTGPTLRASGEPYDVRKAEPYSIYDRFDFKIPTLDVGDCYARYLIRLAEIRQSLRILEQALNDLPPGEVQAKVPRLLRPPPGDAYSRIESPKGELGFYLVSEGGINPYRFHVRPPTLINLTVLPELVRGLRIPDLVAIIGSIDIVIGEIDR
jgi:NADH:ubiquinone oxidoreductase subunit D